MNETGKRKPAAEFWFNSEAGIKGHYQAQRELEARLHQEKMQRLNDEELAFLAAFEARQGGAA